MTRKARKALPLLTLVVAGCLCLATQASAYVYWGNLGSGTIARANLDGSGVDQSFIGGAGALNGVAVDAQHLYWAGAGSGTIGRADLDGQNVDQDFISIPSYLAAVAVDGSHIYWASSSANALGRANLDGSGIDPSFITADTPQGVAVDSGHVYWTNPPDGTIGRANLDGSGVDQSFIGGLDSPLAVAVDSQHVYWTAGNGTIGRANLDGSGVDQGFIGGSDALTGVAVDASHIYWTSANSETDTIGRANLDGSGVDQSFIGGADVPFGVAVDARSATSLTTSASPGTTFGGSVHDTATLAEGQAPSGTIEFSAYGPNDSDCSNPPAFTSTVNVNAGNGSYPSADFIPAAAGAYRWTASYSGDAINDASATACNDAGESVTVAKADQTITFAQPAGRTFGDPDFDPGATASSGLAVTYSSQTEAVCTIVAGKLHLLAAGECKATAEQPGDADYNGAPDVPRAFEVAKATPTLSTAASADVALGAGSLSDTATLAGGQGTPGGSVTFKLYGPDDAGCSRSPAFTDTKTVAGNGSYDSADFEPTEAGVYRWTASYGGDSNNDQVSSACNAANESVTVSQTPDHIAYVANSSSGTVTPIDTATDTAGTAIAVGSAPVGIAISPDGATAYVADQNSDSVTPIDTATDTAGTPIAVGSAPVGIAISPDGATAYVANAGSGTVTPIDTATDTAGTPIAVGSNPVGIAITPDGATAYVADQGSASVTPIDTATDTAGTPIPVGVNPQAIAISPDGATAYVADQGSASVTPIDTATDSAGTPIAVGATPAGIAITPDGATAYVTDRGSSSVTPIDTATDTARTPIAVGTGPFGIAITPDQAPTAAFT
ncbi:MAG TPA: hypothetical protein VHV53_10300, partial [Solirubrobacterales bacterium]|nr:hypothetical protein [Solirubrobacterales bacterium]